MIARPVAVYTSRISPRSETAPAQVNGTSETYLLVLQEEPAIDAVRFEFGL
jgi:hypothetical protein